MTRKNFDLSTNNLKVIFSHGVKCNTANIYEFSIFYYLFNKPLGKWSYGKYAKQAKLLQILHEATMQYSTQKYGRDGA